MKNSVIIIYLIVATLFASVSSSFASQNTPPNNPYVFGLSSELITMVNEFKLKNQFVTRLAWQTQQAGPYFFLGAGFTTKLSDFYTVEVKNDSNAVVASERKFRAMQFGAGINFHDSSNNPNKSLSPFIEAAYVIYEGQSSAINFGGYFVSAGFKYFYTLQNNMTVIPKFGIRYERLASASFDGNSIDSSVMSGFAYSAGLEIRWPQLRKK